MLALFEKLKLTLVVMSTIPLSVFWSIFILFLQGNINTYSFMGIITLGGVILKHGILFVSTASSSEEVGEEAAIQAAVIRLKPVLMTSLAMSLGVLPLIFETDPVMIRMKQIAITLLPGISLGTIMVLFVIPSIYCFLETKN